MQRSKRPRIRNGVQVRENMKAEAVRQRSLMLLKDYRSSHKKDDGDQGNVYHDGSTRAPPLYPSVQQTASKYGGNSSDKILPKLPKNHVHSQMKDRSKVVTERTAINSRSNNSTTTGDLRHVAVGNRRKLEEHPAVVCPQSKREKQKILKGRDKNLSVKGPFSKGHFPGPSVATAHVCPGPGEICNPCFKVTYHSGNKKTEDHHSCDQVPSYPTVAEDSDKDYLKLESTERKIKDFLRRTSAVAASRSNKDIMESESSHENDLLSGFVGPEERKRQFSKVYHLEPPRALSGLSGTTNSPVDSYSSPVNDRSDSPLILPPLALPPIQQHSTQRQQQSMQIGTPGKARKPLTGREWRQLKKCRYLRLGPHREDPNMKELSLQEVFPSNITSK